MTDYGNWRLIGCMETALSKFAMQTESYVQITDISNKTISHSIRDDKRVKETKNTRCQSPLQWHNPCAGEKLIMEEKFNRQNDISQATLERQLKKASCVISNGGSESLKGDEPQFWLKRG